MKNINKQIDRIITGNREDDFNKTFNKFNLKVMVTYLTSYGPWAVHEVKLKGNTRESQICARIPDVQSRLQIKRLLFKKSSKGFLIFSTDEDIEYDHLPVILTNEAYLDEFRKKELPYPVGFDIIGLPTTIDLSQAPHLLLGGASGSGKSAGLLTLITSVAYMKTPDKVNFVLIDAGAADLMHFEGLPHLSCPIIQSQNKASHALTAIAAEMKRRIKLEYSNPDEYAALPRLVVVIDEFPALFVGLDNKERKSLTSIISALLQRGRHGKIHLVLAAQNPTFNNMKVDIGNITARIAFKCAKKNFSEVILGEAGAENLTGKGELLLKAPNFDNIERLQGMYVTPDELRQLVRQIKRRLRDAVEDEGKFTIASELLNPPDEMDISDSQIIPPVTGKASAENQALARVLLWAFAQNSISVNRLASDFHLGWNRANRLMSELEGLGIVDELDAKLPRPVVPVSIEDIPTEMLDFLQRNGISDEAVYNAINTRVSVKYASFPQVGGKCDG